MKLGIVADSHVSVDRFEPVRWHNEFDLRGSCMLLRRALEHALLSDVDAVLVLGDLVHWGDRASLREMVAIADDVGRPTVLLQGNHDVLVPDVRLEEVLEEADAKAIACAFRSDNPAEPLRPFVDAAIGLHVQEVRAETLHTGGRWPFEVAARRLVEVSSPRARVVATHFPVLSTRRAAREAGLLYSGHLSDLADASDLALDVDAPTIVLSGHLHLRAVATEGPVLQIVFAALVEAPYDVAVVDVVTDDDGSLVVEYECASVRDVSVAALPVLAPASARWIWPVDRGRWECDRPAERHPSIR